MKRFLIVAMLVGLVALALSAMACTDVGNQVRLALTRVRAVSHTRAPAPGA